MKIFKELKKLGYKHYTEHTIEELDDLPLNSEERIMEQALVLRWFREKYMLYHSIDPLGYNMCLGLVGELGKLTSCNVPHYGTYEEAELECLKKLIEIVKTK